MGFRRSEVRILSPRHSQGQSRQQVPTGLFSRLGDSFRPQGSVAGRNLTVPKCPIPFFGSLIRGCHHPPSGPPSRIHPELVRASSTHFEPQITAPEQLAIEIAAGISGAVQVEGAISAARLRTVSQRARLIPIQARCTPFEHSPRQNATRRHPLRCCREAV
jgi:hypothetical protein